MKHFSLNAWNDWRWVGSYRADVTLLRVNFDYLREMFVSVDFVLLGFGFSLSYYPNGKGGAWGDVAGVAITAYCDSNVCVGDGIQTSYSWEPIETDGWAGEPQGKEHAP